jgi:hypothetical protein
MEPVVLALICTAVGASIVIAAVALLALIVLKGEMAGRLAARGSLKLLGAACHGEIEATREK